MPLAAIARAGRRARRRVLGIRLGRQREAEFQWRRALSFVDLTDADSEADPERMRRKLEVGLDAVLSEEGAAPLKVAADE